MQNHPFLIRHLTVPYLLLFEMKIKKTHILLLAVSLQIISLTTFAQEIANEWRLTNKSWKLPNGESSRLNFTYDSKGQIVKIQDYQNNRLHATQGEFLYNKQNRIISYNETFSDGADTIKHVYRYDDQNRLISAEEIKMKKAGNRTTLTKTFSYEKNKINEHRIRPSFGGKLVDEIIYELDGSENMVRKTTISDGKKTADYIYGEYDKKPNPLIFTGAYFFTELSSAYNSKEGYWENDKPARTIFTYTTAGLLQNAAITFILDNRPYTHNYKYTYSRIKTSSK